jgi:uncharacterized protein YciI
MAEQPTPQWIYQFFPVRPEMVTNPDLWTEADNRLAEEHFAYLKRATEEGTVLLAGRAQNGEGPAIVIIEAPSEEAARHFMENDPFVSGGFARARLHPFRAALVRKSGS